MIEYIYIVKCPECDDEQFGFFDEAKDYAMSCLTKKPVITQTEINRNDFGECTDHCDLGTVWSWEDMMEGTEPEDTQTLFRMSRCFSSSPCARSMIFFSVFSDAREMTVFFLFLLNFAIS